MRIVHKVHDSDATSLPIGEVAFQNGPIQESGVNGVQNEDLLVIVIDRLRGFQAGAFACSENQAALEFCEEALKVLEGRTAARKARGIEGKSVVE